MPDKEPVFGCRKHRLDRGSPTGDTPGPLMYAGYPNANKGMMFAYQDSFK